MKTFSDFLSEGVNDPAIFAVFLPRFWFIKSFTGKTALSTFGFEL